MHPRRRTTGEPSRLLNRTVVAICFARAASSAPGEVIQTPLRRLAKGLHLTPGIAINITTDRDPVGDLLGIITQENRTNATDATHMSLNTKGDFEVVMAAVRFNLLLILIFVVAFCALRRAFPLVYSYYGTREAGEEQSPRDLPGAENGWLAQHFGWIPAGFNATLSDRHVESEGGRTVNPLVASVGLDSTQLLEFCNLCIKIFATISCPLVLIMCPLHRFSSAGNAETLDRISLYGMSNLDQDNVLFWVHAAIVWAVVIVVTQYVRNAQLAFTEKRFRWLENMREPRGSTILVQDIPEQYQSDTKLEEYFVKMFSRSRVDSAHTVKDTGVLADLARRLKDEVKLLRSSIFLFEKSGAHERPQEREGFHMIDAIDKHREQIKVLLGEIRQERAAVEEQAKELGGVNTSSGFVRFTHHRDVQVSMSVRFSPWESWYVTRAPEPEDVAWASLVEPRAGRLRTVAGYVLILALFNFSMTIVVGITRVAEYIKSHAGVFSSLLEAVVPTVGFSLLMSFLPTILVLIFRNFFKFDSESTLQRMLFRWYFWFLVLFILLVSVMGTTPAALAMRIANNPNETPSLLACSLPDSSNFYIRYILFVVSTHFMNLTRYWVVFKYVLYRAKSKDSFARLYAEPEDQDYYGIGARSAQWSIAAVIGLVYCQLCPQLGIVVLLHFIACRLVYGHLVLFSETRKSDMGGEIWVDQLQSFQQCLVIYILLMCGVLVQGGGKYCGMIAGLSLLYLWDAYRHFRLIFWKSLPFELVPSPETDGKMPHSMAYVQPELKESRVEEDAWQLVGQDGSGNSDDEGKEEETNDNCKLVTWAHTLRASKSMMVEE